MNFHFISTEGLVLKLSGILHVSMCIMCVCTTLKAPKVYSYIYKYHHGD